MWYCAPFFGLWWICPLMFIFCMVMMFFVMRAFFTGRFHCCGMHPGHRGQDDAHGRQSGAGREGTDEQEG